MSSNQEHLSNQEQLIKYRRQYKTKITEETKLKVGDIVIKLSEDVFMVTSVSKCFITMKYMRPSAAPILTCEGSIVGCVDYVFKIDTGVLPETNPRRISKKKMIECDCYSVSTDLENIYSITTRDWLR
jgi:hypothetical protein